jgi:hypothetical protein
MKTEDPTFELRKALGRLSANLERANSLKHVFWRGVISGIGTVIGATIVAAIGLTLAFKILQAVGIDQLLPESFVQVFEKND